VRGKVTEGTSALFLLVGQVTTDRVVEVFRAAPKFQIIASNLLHEQEEKLKAAFASLGTPRGSRPAPATNELMNPSQGAAPMEE
jgi:uncharacterized membrane protein